MSFSLEDGMIEVRALGPLDLRSAHGPLEAVLAQPKRAALVAYLALARPRGYQARDTLLTLFWPQSNQHRARNSLSQSLTFLRRHLPKSVLVTHGRNVKLDPDALVADVLGFEEAMDVGRWGDALDLYRGEFLAGFHVSDAPEFDLWLGIERDRLRELAAKAAWARAEEWIEGGEPVEAERVAQRALLLAPTDETPVRRFMEALAGAGERAAALSFYDRFCSLLGEALDVEPSSETTTVAVAIRNESVPISPLGGPAPNEGTLEFPRDGSLSPEPVNQEPSPGWEPPNEPHPTGRRTSSALVTGSHRSRRRWPFLILSAMLMVTAALLAQLIHSPEPASPRVMVLPFENRTGDASLEPLGHMVADWISNALIQVSEIEIVPRELLVHALAEAGPKSNRVQPPLLHRMATATGATIAVTGAYYRRGEGLEFHTQLLDLASNEPMASIQPVQGPVADPVKAVDSLQLQVLGALAARFSPMVSLELPRSAEPPTYDAYLAYVQGIQSWFVGDFADAAQWFEEAFARDTTYLHALSWAWAARMKTDEQGLRDSLQTFLRVRRERLSRYDQYWLDVYDARTRGDHAAWVKAARGAVELNPMGPLRLSLILALMESNRPVEARDQLESWMSSLPPAARWYALPVLHADILHVLGDYPAELDVARRHQREIPSDNLSLEASEMRALAALGKLNAFRGRVTEIEALAAQGLNLARTLAPLALELRAHGHREASLELVDHLLRWHRQLPREVRVQLPGRELRASLLYMRERWDEALDLWAVLEQNATDSYLIRVVGMKGLSAARQGDRTSAEASARRLAGLRPDIPTSLGETTLYRARIAAVLGDRDRAVELLREAFAEGQAFGLWLHRDMDLEPLRGHPPYEKLSGPAG